MPRLPPAEKLPLALRKNLRDEWDAKKPELEARLTEVLGETWTIDVNPLAIWPYATDSYAKDSLGSCLFNYFDSAIDQLKSFASTHEDEGKAELNAICHTHVLTIDLDEAKKFSYCGVIVADGKLTLVFKEGYLGTNISYAIEQGTLADALNAAPAPESAPPMSYKARAGIRQEYNAKIEETRGKIAALLEKPDFKLNGNFEANFAAIQAAAQKKNSGIRDDWEAQLGYLTRLYFEGVLWQLNSQKFGDDEMLREGFNEAVDKEELTLRVVDKLKYGSYNEVVIDGGLCALQTTASNFGTNVDYAAEKLLDQL